MLANAPRSTPQTVANSGVRFAVEDLHQLVELGNDWVIPVRGQRSNHLAVVPERLIPVRCETFPEIVADGAEISKDASGVVEFVASRDQLDIGGLSREVLKVGDLALFPGRLRRPGRSRKRQKSDRKGTLDVPKPSPGRAQG